MKFSAPLAHPIRADDFRMISARCGIRAQTSRYFTHSDAGGNRNARMTEAHMQLFFSGAVCSAVSHLNAGKPVLYVGLALTGIVTLVVVGYGVSLINSGVTGQTIVSLGSVQVNSTVPGLVLALGGLWLGVSCFQGIMKALADLANAKE